MQTFCQVDRCLARRLRADGAEMVWHPLANSMLGSGFVAIEAIIFGIEPIQTLRRNLHRTKHRPFGPKADFVFDCVGLLMMK